MYTTNEKLPTHVQIERRPYQIYLELGFLPDNADGCILHKESKKEPSKAICASVGKEMAKPRMSIETSGSQRRTTNVR